MNSDCVDRITYVYDTANDNRAIIEELTMNNHSWQQVEGFTSGHLVQFYCVYCLQTRRIAITN